MRVTFKRLVKSPIGGKKWRVVLLNEEGKERHVDFGATGYTDFTLSKSEDKKALYLQRHKAREDWTKSGIFSAGFWSRWLLWNKSSISASLSDVKSRFNL
jgi:Family of unknown function (DUF5754)